MIEIINMDTSKVIGFVKVDNTYEHIGIFNTRYIKKILNVLEHMGYNNEIEIGQCEGVNNHHVLCFKVRADMIMAVAEIREAINEKEYTKI